jgi:NAD(P)-dependent dehydrogenase (short-subunit alcohol dehydrogenase family)
MSRYAEAHANPQGANDARPTALQIIEDEGLIGKLEGKFFFVIGVSSGIGIETLKALHATGAHVFSTVRDVWKGQAAVDSILAEKVKTGGKITLIKMELDSLASVRAGAQGFLQRSKILNVLINNAGVMATPEGRTKDGFGTQFGTNHLGQLSSLRATETNTARFRYPGVSLSRRVCV